MGDIASLRPDFDRIRTARNETRSPERLAAHHEVEVRLARRLAQSTPAERQFLYSDVYQELFASVADHPQHRGQRELRLERIRMQARALLKQLPAGGTFVEIGCGDAALTKEMALHAGLAIGIDVTAVLVTSDAPATFRFVKSDGVTLEVPDGTVDLVFSNQLMEHLHVDDAVAQLKEIFRILKPGGRYICNTPNRLTGPHDISVYFGHEPTGFHLREYDHRSLASLFRSIGFSRMLAAVTLKGRQFNLPVGLVGAAEAMLEALPRRLRTEIALQPIAVNVFGVNLVGIK